MNVQNIVNYMSIVFVQDHVQIYQGNITDSGECRNLLNPENGELNIFSVVTSVLDHE